MLVHTCGNQVMVDISSVVKIVSPVGVVRGGLRAQVGDVIQVSDTGDASFFCPTCNVVAPQADLRVQCEECGHNVAVRDGYRTPKAGGIYCEQCVNEYFPGTGERINITKVTVKK
jgi:hypothetical protein